MRSILRSMFIYKIEMLKVDVVAHTFNPVLWRQGQVDLCDSEASLVYIVSSRPDQIKPARAT